ncbi:hypothetical protein JG687_00004153 [Phytophthora cactorum]|uniref:Uncharacterized protein n=1 Tax=Phytophthora cactorum TaxID=29920 RepID=A0A8T1UPX7_9STRA|nr:hypothetical protein JG687_00004153 [Phytophthora cactorum]
MQVKPWMTTEPSCSLLVFDCYESKINGQASEFISQWSHFDRKTTSRVVIHHCPKLEVPDNGELPAGLLSDDFPLALGDIELCATNLRSLPEDLDLKWPKFASIYLERCELTEVPESLARLAPFDLSLAMNPISTLPPSLLEGGVGYLHVGSTLISELPANVTEISSFLVVRVDNTTVSFFWDWIDTLVEHNDIMISVIHPILATNSPYCSDLQRIYDGEQNAFSRPWRDSQSRILSNASVENWPVLQAAVACGPWPSTWYPLDFEDVYSGIKDV